MTRNRKKRPEDLRSSACFNNPDDIDQAATLLEHYLNYGLTQEEMRSGRPVIGIAQSGSDLAPCNRHHQTLALRLRDGIRDAGGIPIEFPIHPIQETGRRPTAALDRNLQSLSLIEILHGYFLDGVVLTTGCDKTTPSQLMAAASVDLPAIALSTGPMLNGRYMGRCVGSGTTMFEARKLFAKGEIDAVGFLDITGCTAPSVGHCNTMGTALTMNCLAEALGMSLPDNASAPAAYRERQQIAYATGRRIVDMVWEDLKPSDLITRSSIENAIVVCAGLGGSTNAQIHINAIAAHAGIDVTMEDWQVLGADVPQIVNCMPVGEYLSEDFHHAGGCQAVLYELNEAGLLNGDAMTANGKSVAENCANRETQDRNVVWTVQEPVTRNGGFTVLTGNLFRSGLLKTSAISDDFRARYLSRPDCPNVCELNVTVFDGPEDYRANIDSPELEIDEHSILVIRGVGPVGYPGSAEVVNMRPPARLLTQGINELPTMGDGRQSGTSGAPSILHVSPEAAAGGGLAILRNGDRIRLDLNERRVDLLIDDEEIAERFRNTKFEYPVNQTWWQQVYRENVTDLDRGGVFEDMVQYKRIGKKLPRRVE
ncbi:MAG: IlvD/Edd family dehydratase [Pseudomonadota bacterium]